MAQDRRVPDVPDAPTRAAASVRSPSPLSARPALSATCWGTRGSIPSPGPSTVRFGGNTACLEIRTADDRCLIFDAGTGIRVLGRRLVESPDPVRADLFFTHFHWDHVQGIPFFAPLYDADTSIHIRGARQGDADIQTLFAGQLGPIYFPIPYDALAADLDFSHLDEHEPWRAGDVEVATIRVRHPAHTLGYRIRCRGASVAYVPDNELFGGDHPASEGWYDRLVEFVGDVDLLFHDAMYTDAEYERREGWGHSTFRQAIRLARDAGVRRLNFFHHAPDRTDDELQRLLDDFRAGLADADATLELGIATEGERHRIDGT